MNDQSKKIIENKPTLGGRLLIVSILFFIPSAILVYFNIYLQIGFTAPIFGYISFIIFTIIYIGIVKGIAWILSRIGVNWR